ncbi:MAG: biopolymer transporter ExbD [Polaromonas sp.]|uniref:ExbD/TolR family protein n=1 Tax=Polaromonas sp. TaxID=1869339 RepID=UPI0025FED862|nr:biopolymer transporter ExbD [Polaromonas sp.]MBI2726822.1 biopolymer transporter ExbD [Polaromonas sp.]
MKLYTQHLSRSSGDDPEAGPMVEMNTTPLIDVMLVLLVMLIITIPVQLHSVNLDMPSMQAGTMPEVVEVQMNAAGFLQWNGETLADMQAVQARMAAARAQPVQPEIHLKPSFDTPYSFVAAFLVMANRAGLQKVGVVNQGG